MDHFSADDDGASAFLLGRVNYERTRPSHPARSFKLDRMRRLLSLVGDPHLRLAVVHVAGTKGKGSTSTMIAEALTASGRRVGLYTSPHLARVEERLRVDGAPCNAAAFAELTSRIRPVVERLDRECESEGRPGDGPTYFEITTALAMLHFVDQHVDAAVLEVGLGGRLDSTNVCVPRVSAITSIGFDHTAQLGTTLAAIAGEKAGIIKPGVSVITGVVDPEPLSVIEHAAERAGSRLLRAGIEFRHELAPPNGLFPRFHYADARGRVLADVELGLVGNHQAANGAVAVATLLELNRQGWEISDDTIRNGLRRAVCPARIEIVRREPMVVLDVAHNVCSVKALVETLLASFPQRRRNLMFACSRDKDAAGMIALLAPHFHRIVFTRFQSNPRAFDPIELAAIARRTSTHDVPSDGVHTRLLQEEEVQQNLISATGVCEGRPANSLAGRMDREPPAESAIASIHVVENPQEALDRLTALADPDELLCIAGSFFLAAELRERLRAPTAPAALAPAT